MAHDSRITAKVSGWKDGRPIVPTTADIPKMTCAEMRLALTKNEDGLSLPSLPVPLLLLPGSESLLFIAMPISISFLLSEAVEMRA